MRSLSTKLSKVERNLLFTKVGRTVISFLNLYYVCLENYLGHDQGPSDTLILPYLEVHITFLKEKLIEDWLDNISGDIIPAKESELTGANTDLKSRAKCLLNTTTSQTFFRDGDLVLGAVMMLFSFPASNMFTFEERPRPRSCFGVSLRYYRHLLTILFAVEEINRNPSILPNITMGFEIHDSCTYESRAVESTFKLLSGIQEHIPNYQCKTKGILAGFIGHLLSSSTYSIAGLTGIYKYPQISYGAQDPVLDDKTLFPSFYRTIPNERNQYDGIIQLLHHFGWTWVGLVASDDESNLRASGEIKTEIIRSGICIAYFEIVSNRFLTSYRRVVDVIKKSSSNVVIIFSSTYIFFDLMLTAKIFSVPGKVWITSTTVSVSTDNMFGAYLNVLNGSLLFSIHKGEIPGLRDFLYSVNPSTLPDDIFTAKVWLLSFGCLPANYSTYSNELGSTRVCTGNKTLKTFDTSYDVNTFRLTYAVYRAVYTLAYALHNMLSSMKNNQQSVDGSNLRRNFRHYMLNQYLKNVRFKTTYGEEFYFEKGSPSGQYDILNWVISPNKTILNTQIGSFIYSSTSGQKLVINNSAIQWNHEFTQVPRSVCSDPCAPGYRKAPRRGEPNCCYDCVACSEGEISNKTDVENCMKCAANQWSNLKRNECISRTIEFLSYEDALGIALSSIAIVLCIITAGILVIFITHRDTPIVKANNRDLTYIMLLSLAMCFLCSLLFIGLPVDITCFLRQAAFGIIFAVAVSSVLAKTITVVIAFNATKPGSKARKWVGSRVSTYLVCLCALGEVVICLAWFLCSPPFADFDTRSKDEKMILQCNEGSVIAFYFLVGYMGLLAVLSFAVAFLARNLPDSFNEAKHVTFSMLVFCSVWLSFIPAYLSTKGKYMVAVEIFAILSSSAGLLGCIFIPKCYIILIRPNLNTKEHLIGKKARQQVESAGVGPLRGHQGRQGRGTNVNGCRAPAFLSQRAGPSDVSAPQLPVCTDWKLGMGHSEEA
ncbi:vomeronasal type-2 receptor 26-like [Ascaphus truei]|uniref:vomeronasal type-2 receptor 26-like n=1 Tax=Ascaphus truei TaxID=8439 RepID=UPI003F59366A